MHCEDGGLTDGYVLNRTSAETARLQVQAGVLAPHSAHLFRLAGITPGMRVLDLGSGAGDVSMLLADLVGPTGSVLGVDIDPAVVELSRDRAAAAGLNNVSFLDTDDALRAGGRDPENGDQVPLILRDAGLTVAGVATAGPAGTTDSVMPDYLAESVRSFLPLILAHGVATESEVDIDALADRVTREMSEAGSTFWSPELIGALASKS